MQEYVDNEIKKFRIEKIEKYNDEIKKQKLYIISSKIGIAANALGIYLLHSSIELQHVAGLLTYQEYLKYILLISLSLCAEPFFLNLLINSNNKKTMYESKLEELEQSLEELEITEKYKVKTKNL